MGETSVTLDQLFAVGALDIALTKDDWYTPPWLFAAAGIVFDLDVAAPVDPARRTCPARQYLTAVEDGLLTPWTGTVWMNPPFSNSKPWVERFVQHGSGLALVPASHENHSLGALLRCADAITLVSMRFGRPDGGVKGLPFSLVLAACGPVATDALARIATADRYMQGAYHVRPDLLK